MSLTRRDFLAGSSALAFAGTLTNIAEGWVPSAKIEAFSFGFCSDTHIGLKSNIGFDTEMFGELAAPGPNGQKPDFLINGGDVTDYGWAQEYANYRSIIDPLGVPVHHIPGNHDVRWSPRGPMAFREGTRSKMYDSFTHKGIHFVLLDSTVPLSHYGHFEAEMLRWLAADLKKLPRNTPILIFTHHWVGREGVMVDTEESLLPIIAPYNVLHIFNGHGHSDLFWHWNGIANTMNKGLYQGSYLRVDIDPKANRIAISRRAGDPKRGAAVPEFLWESKLVLPHRQPPSETAFEEWRLDGGEWISRAENLRTEIPGTHRVTLRKRNGRGKGSEFDYATAKPITISSRGATRVLASAELPGGVMSHLRLDGDDLFVSCMDGTLLRLNAETLRPKWRSKAKDYCHSSPTVTPVSVLVGSADGTMTSHNRADGKPRWSVKTNGPVYSSAAIEDGVVAFGSGDGRVYGVDEATGKELWTLTLVDSAKGFVQAPLLAHEGHFYFGAWDGNVYCLDAKSGKIQWMRDALDNRSFAYSPAIGNPIVVGPNLVVPSNGNILWAMDLKSGEVAWRRSSPGDKFGYSSPTSRDGKIYTGGLGPKGQVFCLDGASGEILWTAETGSDIYDSGPALGKDWLAIGRVSGALAIVNLADGKVRAQRQLATGHFLSTPVAREDQVWAATFNNRVVRIAVDE